MKITGKAVGFANAFRRVRQIANRVDMKTMAIREAERLRAIIIGEFSSGKPVTTTFGSWPDHKPLTLVERELEGHGGTLPLVRTASMRNAVAVKQTGRGAWVGVSRKAGPGRKRGVKKPRAKKPRKGRKLQGGSLLERLERALKREAQKKKSKEGKDTRKPKPGKGVGGKKTRANLANVAELMEFGSRGSIAVKMTPAMRRFLFGVLFKKGGTAGKVGGKKKGFVVYRIPARPFLRPAQEAWERTLPDSIAPQIDAILGRS